MFTRLGPKPKPAQVILEAESQILCVVKLLYASSALCRFTFCLDDEENGWREVSGLSRASSSRCSLAVLSTTYALRASSSKPAHNCDNLAISSLCSRVYGRMPGRRFALQKTIHAEERLVHILLSVTCVRVVVLRGFLIVATIFMALVKSVAAIPCIL